jgi:hypothetical protein
MSGDVTGDPASTSTDASEGEDGEPTAPDAVPANVEELFAGLDDLTAAVDSSAAQAGVQTVRELIAVAHERDLIESSARDLDATTPRRRSSAAWCSRPRCSSRTGCSTSPAPSS